MTQEEKEAWVRYENNIQNIMSKLFLLPPYNNGGACLVHDITSLAFFMQWNVLLMPSYS